MRAHFGRLLLGLLLLLSFGLDIGNVTQGGAIDLRNRVTGVRLLAHGIDPYFYKWQEPGPPEYCDPYNNLLLPVSKTTATPALLLIHLPQSVLPYRLGQFLWFLVQWILLLGTGWLLLRPVMTVERRWLWAAFIIGFSYTAAWRLHAERGQSYVLLLFVLAFWLTVTLDVKWGNRWVTGLIAGFLVALRPPFFLIFPFLGLHRRGQLLGALAGLLVSVVLPALLHLSCWSDYFSAMQTHSELYRAGTDPHPPSQLFPATIEGVPTDILARYVAIPYADFSVQALFHALDIFSFPALPPLVAVTAAFGVWLWQLRKQRFEIVLLGLAAWLFLIDFFVPAYRDSYNDVLLLDVFGLGLMVTRRLSLAAGFCLIGLPLGWMVYTLVPEQAWLIDLPTLAFSIGALFYLAPGVPLAFWRK